MAISVVVLLALMFPVLAGVGMAWRSDWSSHTWLARSDGVVRLDIEVFLLTVTASAALVLTVLYVQSSGGLSQIRVPARPAEAGEKGSSDLSPLTNIDIREAVSARLAPVLVRAGLVPKENVRAPVPAAGLTLISPTDGTVIESTTVTVAFETTGIRLAPAERVAEENNHRPDESPATGAHLHLMLDLRPVEGWSYDTPYTFTNVTPGEHLLTVELMSKDHASFSPPVVQQVRFTVAGAPQLLPVSGSAYPAP